jgi:hypothetical protein
MGDCSLYQQRDHETYCLTKSTRSNMTEFEANQENLQVYAVGQRYRQMAF